MKRSGEKMASRFFFSFYFDFDLSDLIEQKKEQGVIEIIKSMTIICELLSSNSSDKSCYSLNDWFFTSAISSWLILDELFFFPLANILSFLQTVCLHLAKVNKIMAWVRCCQQVAYFFPNGSPCKIF